MTMTIAAVPTVAQHNFAQFVDNLAKMAFLAFIESGRGSLHASSAIIIDAGYDFMKRVYHDPRPKNDQTIAWLQNEIKVALLDGIIQRGMPGVEDAVRASYDQMAQVADTKSRPSATPASTASTSRDEMVLKVRETVAEQLGIELVSVTLTSSFVNDLKADSLDLVEMVMLLEDRINLEIDDEEAFALKTVGDVVDLACRRFNVVDTLQTER